MRQYIVPVDMIVNAHDADEAKDLVVKYAACIGETGLRTSVTGVYAAEVNTSIADVVELDCLGDECVNGEYKEDGDE
jgi:hypothetical protein